MYPNSITKVPSPTLAFHNDTEPRKESGIGIVPGPQELDSSANEGSDDAPAAVVRIRGLPARAEIEPLLTHVSSAKPTKEKKIEQAFRQWAGARGHATSGTAHGGTDESADEVAPKPRGTRGEGGEHGRIRVALPAIDSQGIGRQGFGALGGTPSLVGAAIDRVRGTRTRSRSAHPQYAARMTAVGPRTTLIYSRSVFC